MAAVAVEGHDGNEDQQIEPERYLPLALRPANDERHEEGDDRRREERQPSGQNLDVEHGPQAEDAAGQHQGQEEIGLRGVVPAPSRTPPPVRQEEDGQPGKNRE